MIHKDLTRNCDRRFDFTMSLRPLKSRERVSTDMIGQGAADVADGMVHTFYHDIDRICQRQLHE